MNRWANWLLTVTNLVAFYSATQVETWIESLALVASGMAGMLFHSCESHKHSPLPGLYQVSPEREGVYFVIDWLFTVLSTLVLFRWAYIYNPFVWIALGINWFSELRYVGVVRSPAWDMYAYPIFHSIWHVIVFSLPLMTEFST